MAEDFAIFGKYIYTQDKYKLYAHNFTQAKEIFEIIASHQNLYFIGYIQYEFYKCLLDNDFYSKTPLLSFIGFAKRAIFRPHTNDCRYYPTFTHKLDKTKYYKDFATIKKAIANGKTYQVNLTQKMQLATRLDSLNLFCTLLKKQNTEFKALLQDDFLEIISFSPELFFSTTPTKNGIKITTEPMKGTIQRSDNAKQDKQNQEFLLQDTKNRSENVMIVDLLRNDISKIIKPHSLETKLFYLKSYPTLHQMVSQISGMLEDNITMIDIFSALFPCGSITGAPKRETMDFISQLEGRNRGVYCGAIGLIHNNTSIFSVAIRILERKLTNSNYQKSIKKSKQSKNYWEFGVGSGITWDSKPKDEYSELKLKTKFLESSLNGFFLFETMRYKNGKVAFLQEHIARLLDSAKKLGFKAKQLSKDFSSIRHGHCFESLKHTHFKDIDTKLFHTDSMIWDDLKQFTHILVGVCELDYPKKDDESILRLELYRDGTYCLHSSKLVDSKNREIIISPYRITKDDLVFHKTSNRGIYTKESEKWLRDICYDVVFCDKNGRLCEGSRSNIVLRFGDIFYTPSLDSGLLNGIYRKILLHLGIIEEKALTLEDIYNAQEIFMINSVRGIQKVSIQKDK